jgi:hypothetical protein
MFMGPIREVERRAEAFSHRLLLEAVGSILAVIGLAFLTTAGWLVLELQGGAIFAATVLGGAYFGLGLILWAAAITHRVRSKPPSPADPYEPFINMAEGFAAGLEAGRAARNPGR